MSRINSCPRCGNEPDFGPALGKSGYYLFTCSRCGFDSQESKTLSGAIESWNRAKNSRYGLTSRNQKAKIILRSLLSDSDEPFKGTAEEAIKDAYELADSVLEVQEAVLRGEYD